MTRPVNVRQARAALVSADQDKREAVLGELEALAASEITDVLSWDADGNVVFRGSDHLDARARKAIKKVKVTPNQHGSAIEIEMHDKLSSLRLLAKHNGLLETDSGVNRPAMIGINLTGPEITYEVKDEPKSTLDGSGDPKDTDGEKVDDPGSRGGV